MKDLETFSFVFLSKTNLFPYRMFLIGFLKWIYWILRGLMRIENIAFIFRTEKICNLKIWFLILLILYTIFDLFFVYWWINVNSWKYLINIPIKLDDSMRYFTNLIIFIPETVTITVGISQVSLHITSDIMIVICSCWVSL